MLVISLDDYRKEGAAAVRPSPSVQAPVNDKTERHHRHRTWREAESVVEYYLALHRFAFAARRAERIGLEPARAAARLLLGDYSDAETMALRRMAVADLIRTPAPTMQQVWWKKRQFKDGHLFEFISPEEARAAIVADEAFHRANPYRKGTTKKGRTV